MTFEIGFDDEFISLNYKGRIQFGHKKKLHHDPYFAKESKVFNDHLDGCLFKNKTQVKKTFHKLTDLKKDKKKNIG